MTTTPKPEPASDEEIERILTYIRLSPWGRDTIKRRIKSDRARIREQAEEIERLEKANLQLDAEGSALAMELALVKSMTVHEFRKLIAEHRSQ